MESRLVGLTGLRAVDDDGLFYIAVFDLDGNDGGLFIVASVPCAVKECKLGLYDLLALGLDIGNGSSLAAKAESIIKAPCPEARIIKAVDRNINGEGCEGGVESRGNLGARAVYAGHFIDKAACVCVALVVHSGGHLGADGFNGADLLRICVAGLERHGAAEIVPAAIALAYACDPAGDHARVGGVLIGAHVAGGIAVYECTGVAGY